MTDRPTLFDELPPAVRAGDPDTARAAALLPGKVTLRARCLEVLRRYPAGLTDFELAELVAAQQTSAGKRRGELVDLGLVEPTELRRPAPSGAMSIVWRVTEAGAIAA